MKKPAYLIDTISNIYYKIPADSEQRLIGRSRECAIQTPANDETISREQLIIQHRPDGIYIRQKSETSPTHIGTKDSPEEETIHQGEVKQIFYGNYLTIGTNKPRQKFVLRSSKDLEKRIAQETQQRIEDTTEIEY